MGHGFSVCRQYGTLGTVAVETCHCRCSSGYSGLACDERDGVKVSGTLGSAEYPASRCADVLWCSARLAGTTPPSGNYFVHYGTTSAESVACDFSTTTGADGRVDPGAWTPLAVVTAGSSGVNAFGGGWEQFFSDGVANVSAVVTSTDSTSHFIRRFPSIMNANHEIRVACGDVGVEFTIPERALKYFQGAFENATAALTAEAEGWHPLHSVRAAPGYTAPAMFPDRLYVGPGGFIVAGTAVGGVVAGFYRGAPTIGPYPDIEFDMCDGQPLSAMPAE